MMWFNGFCCFPFHRNQVSLTLVIQDWSTPWRPIHEGNILLPVNNSFQDFWKCHFPVLNHYLVLFPCTVDRTPKTELYRVRKPATFLLLEWTVSSSVGTRLFTLRLYSVLLLEQVNRLLFFRCVLFVVKTALPEILRIFDRFSTPFFVWSL